MILHGRIISPGLFEGRARQLDARALIEAASRVASLRTPSGEIERLHAAVARACTQLEQVAQRLSEQGRGDDSEIFAAHLSMMRDPVLLERIKAAILNERRSAESAIAGAATVLHAHFEANTVAMVRDKAPDVLDIAHRLLRSLDPGVERHGDERVARVLIAQTLTPSDLVQHAQRGPCAAITEACGSKSHVALLARSLGVPLLTGVAGATRRFREDAHVLVDANRGIAVVDASPEDEAEVARIRAAIVVARHADPEPGQPTTLDGVDVTLALNISGSDEAEWVGKLGAKGVGLFRTEFLFMGCVDWPDEAECLEAYERTARAMGDGELHVRLADFGADKQPHYADFPVGRNPSLGARGVRLLLQRDDILGPQVRALCRLSAHRSLVVLVPMLDSVDTLRRLKRRLAALCSRPLNDLPFQMGAMVEVPAAAFAIDEILEEVDFAAIGLNDLTQYMLAADREDEAVEHYHDPLQPAILRLVRHVVRTADEQGKPVSVCGELAGDSALTAALLALGIRRLSVARLHYATVCEVIRNLSMAALESRRDDILEARTPGEVRQILAELQ